MPQACLRPGDAALYIDPADKDSLVHAIDSLVQDVTLQQQLKAAGKARAARFTWEKTAQKTLAIFRQVA